MKLPLSALLLGCLTLLTGCLASGGPAAGRPTAQSIPAAAPVAEGTVLWKERLEQPYVFLEHVGDQRNLGSTLDSWNWRSSSA